jgi:sarcosine oxidase gamma subunit
MNDQLVDLLFNLLIAAAGFLAANYLKDLSNNIREAVNSVKELNSKVAVIIERTETHAFEIDRLRSHQESMVEDLAVIKAVIGNNEKNK